MPEKLQFRLPNTTKWDRASTAYFWSIEIRGIHTHFVLWQMRFIWTSQLTNHMSGETPMLAKNSNWNLLPSLDFSLQTLDNLIKDACYYFHVHNIWILHAEAEISFWPFHLLLVLPSRVFCVSFWFKDFLVPLTDYGNNEVVFIRLRGSVGMEYNDLNKNDERDAFTVKGFIKILRWWHQNLWLALN